MYGLHLLFDEISYLALGHLNNTKHSSNLLLGILSSKDVYANENVTTTATILKAHLHPRIIAVVYFYFESLYCLNAWSDWLNALKAAISSSTCQLQTMNFINIHPIYTK